MELAHQWIAVNGIELSLYTAGPDAGLPVWLLHGFPECWYSWREQIAPLTQAGYRVFIPELRGYGKSSAPEAVEAYDLLTLCADIQAAFEYFAHHQLVLVGHDWGALLAWHLALLEPKRISALCTMSVPFAGRAKRPVTQIMQEASAGRFNYILYFQAEGLAEAELEGDIQRTLRLLMHYNAGNLLLQNKAPNSRLFEPNMQVEALPHWCSEADLHVYVQAFSQHGFRGPLNWYRNFERNWQLTACLDGQRVEVPTLFLIGAQDPVGRLEAYTLSKMPLYVADLEQHVLDNAGHWLQSQAADEVNAYLLDFLARRSPAVTVKD